MRIDLHSHSTASDGTDPPAEVMRRARAAGLDAIALTDHDTLAGHAEAGQACPPGLTLIPGLELSCQHDNRSMHMLGYLMDPGHAELAAECRAIRDGRRSRARDMVDRLRALGVPVSWAQVTELAGGDSVGRPHVARAMVAAGAIEDEAQAFTPEWIGTGGRAHVTRYAPDPVRAVGLIRAAGGVAVLAHPGARGWQIPDEVIAGLAGAGLAGLEVAHPEHDQDERRRLAGLAADLGLVASGGSDDHGRPTGHRLGCEVIAADQFDRLMAQATGPSLPTPANRPRRRH